MLIGIYARYSTADQSETSIADQIRRCRNTIAHKKITATREIMGTSINRQKSGHAA